MKKTFALLLVVTLLAALSLPVFAAYEAEANEGNVALEFKGYAEKPVIDGKLDEYGYSKVDISAGDISYAANDSTDDGIAAAQGLSFDVYASYDADYLYFFVSTDTKYYYNDMDANDGNIWGQSAIQLNLASVGDEGSDRLEFGIGRNSIDGAQHFTVWAQHPDAENELELAEGTDFIVTLDGDRVNYELRVPVTTFKAAGSKLNAGDKITWCLVMAQCDKENGEGGTGGYLHTQIASGCTGDPGKAAQNFATITLGAAIEKPAEVVEVVPEAVEETQPAGDAAQAPATTAPATGDMTIVFVILAVVAAAGASLAIKRRKEF